MHRQPSARGLVRCGAGLMFFGGLLVWLLREPAMHIFTKDTAVIGHGREYLLELLRFLAMRLRKERTLPKPRIYSQEELAAMVAEDEADGERFRQGR